MSKSADRFTYLIGIAVLGIILWQVIGFILPDQPSFETGEEFLEELLEESGGLSQWESIKTFRFDKSFKIYNAGQQLESSRNEEHFYLLSPQISREIHYKNGPDFITMMYNNDRYTKLVNAAIDSLTTQSAIQQSMQAGVFVINLPFSLSVKNATLTYLGIETFQEEKAHKLMVTFKESNDIWHLYYNKQSLTWLGYWVKTSDHYSLIVNEEMEEVKGFMLPRKRKSYRTDSAMNIQYLRATYDYDNYKIEF